MEKMIEQGRLYDFYGELLTPHQRKLYEAAVYDDLSLAEIAEQEGISRQGVHDLLKRATTTLMLYEDKLHMIERFDRINEDATKLLHRSRAVIAEQEKEPEQSRQNTLQLAKEAEQIAGSIIRNMRR
ncbi:MAG: DNA-binding protein [Lachnospiraceae bacterium]|nr:DNA-binding protein [Lachnospiraceae bacterium]